MVDERTQSFLVTLGINLGIALIVSLIFCYLRTRFSQVYEPRLESKWRNLYRTFSAPPPVPRGYFSWIPHIYKLTDQQIYETAGLDALMLVRFFGIMTRLFLYSLIPAIAIAIPVNVTGNNRIRDPNRDLPGQPAYKTPDEFSQLSLANIANGSARMVVALLFLWFFTGLALYMSLHLWRTYMHYRHLYLSQRQLTNRHLTLLVRNLPKDYNETSVQNYFQSVYQHTVMDVTVPRNLHKLHKLTVEREAAIGKLERAYYDMEHEKQHKRPTTATRSLCCGKRDAIEHWSNRIQDLNTRILELQRANHPLYPAAFVTMNSSFLVSTLPHIKQNDHIDQYKIKTAPDPDDVDYDALKYSCYSRSIRYIIFTTATAALILFWSIPVSIAASFANLQGLADEVSWLSWIHSIPTGVINLIQGYLPAIILFLFLFLLPKILLWFAHEKGIAAYTWQQMSVIRAMFLFMVINYFLVFTFSGSLLNQLGPILNEPLSLPAILGVAFPAQATAFAEIILFKALLGFPVSALAIGGLVGYIKHRYMAKTPREQYYALHPSDVTYGSVYPTHLFILILGFVYVIIAPIVTLFALVYYLLGYIVAKYQVTYMLVPRHESGGRHWPIVFGRYITSLIVAQLTLIGLFGVKETYGPLVASTPLPFITYAFYRYVKQSYGVRSEYLPAQYSIGLDNRRGTSFSPLNTLAIKQHDASEEMKMNKHDMYMMDQRYRQVERDMGQAYAPNTWEWSNVSLDWDRQYLDHDELVPTATTRPTSMIDRERRDSGYQSTYGHDTDIDHHHHEAHHHQHQHHDPTEADAASRDNSAGTHQQYSHQMQQQQHQMHHAVEIQS